MYRNSRGASLGPQDLRGDTQSLRERYAGESVNWRSTGMHDRPAA